MSTPTNRAPLPPTSETAAVSPSASSSSSSSASTAIFSDGRLFRGGVQITAAPGSSRRSAGGSLTTSLQGEVFRQTRTLQRLAGLTYEQFLSYIKELNEISSHFLDSNGKQLVFAVKKGSDTTLLWKATVRVACVKIDNNSKNVESHQALNLRQFTQVYDHLKNQMAVIDSITESTAASAGSQDEAKAALKNISLEISELGTALQQGNSEAQDDGSSAVDYGAAGGHALSRKPASVPDECIICFERKPDTILPCAHSYCLPCIEQWNVDHKTCPVCRETLTSTDDGWVISDGPDALEIVTDIQKALMNLTQ